MSHNVVFENTLSTDYEFTTKNSHHIDLYHSSEELAATTNRRLPILELEIVKQSKDDENSTVAFA